MEQTIEERARSIYPPLYDYEDCCQSYDGVQTDKRNAYIAGAKDQKQIDIDKACKWLDEHAEYYFHCSEPDYPDDIRMDANFIDEFRKAMEE